ncbi:MAG TPA: hypothetical protein VEI97_03200 [bacterium]|nr:hypothetical protein [bacterium]
MTRTILLLLATFLLLGMVGSGCQKSSQDGAARPLKTAAPKGQTFGAAVEGTPISVSELLADPASRQGQEVVVEGIMGEVCQSMGCWFYLQDPATAGEHQPKQIYIDLQMGAVFTMPKDAKGRQARVLGRVEPNGSDWKLIGKGVVLS